MIDELYIPVSPNPYDELPQHDAFCKVFTLCNEPLDFKDEINQEKLYFQKSTEEIKSNNIITYEDFDKYYKKFTDIEEINEVENDNYENPSFFIYISQESFFSAYENEKFVNVIINDYEVGLTKKKIIEESNDEKHVYKNLEMNPTKSDSSISEANKYNNYDIYSVNKFKGLKKKKAEEIYFPFNPGKGIINSYKFFEDSYPTTYQNQNYITTSNQDQDYSMNFSSPVSNSINLENSDNLNTDKNSGDNNDEENSYYMEHIRNGTENSLFKFTTKKYFVLPNGKKRRMKKKRKYKSDDIRKKIKSRFHKTLKNIINEYLKKAGSKKFFDFLPQCFIGNISKKINSECLDMTYKEILSTNFISDKSKDEYPNKRIDNRKYMRNLDVLKYLEKNPEICKRSGFDIIGEKKYKDLLQIYFFSSEFENSIIRLKKENESKEYIQEYILRARSYVSFYSNYGKSSNTIIDEDNSEE